MTFFFAMFLLLPYSALAEVGVITPKTPEQQDFYIHSGAAYALNFTASQAMYRAGFPRSASILLSSIVSIVALYGKEQIIDDQYSSTDMAGNVVGVSAAAATFVLIEF